MKMTIFRVVKNNNYTVINNSCLNDNNLSWKAKGLLVWLLSRPDNWKILLSDLKNRSTDGRDATTSGINELIEHGYIERESVRDEKGCFSGYNYTVYEESRCGKTDAVNPTMEKPTLLSTDTKLSTNFLVSTNSAKGKKTPQFNYDDFDEQETTAINEWLAYKKEIKKFYKTQIGFDALRKNLLKLKDDNILIESITFSMGKEYADVYPPHNQTLRVKKPTIPEVGDFSMYDATNCVQLLNGQPLPANLRDLFPNMPKDAPDPE